MEKLDRLDWAVGMTLTAHGLRLGIRSNSAEALSAVLKALPPGLKRSRLTEVDHLYSVIAGDGQEVNGIRKFNMAYANATILARSTEFDGIPAAVEAEVSLTMAEFARDRVFVHAGVVGWNGQAVVIPGPSMSGKSSLVMALLRAGATYYSDEFALVDEAGWVHAHPSRIQIRNGDGSAHHVRPASVQARVGKKPLKVGLVLATRYRKGGGGHLRKGSTGEGVLALLTNTASAQREPQRALRTFAVALAGARVLKGPRGEADATVARLLHSDQLPG